MSRPPRGYRSSLVVGTVLCAALALAGCSAGTVTQTDTVVSGAPGAAGQTGEVLLRDVTIDAGPTEVVAAGAPVALRGTLVNQGATPDRLVAVSSPYAAGAQIQGATVVPGDSAVRMVGTEPGPVGPPAQGVRTNGTLRLVLNGATQPLRPGPTYAVTFTFERAGVVTLPVNVIGSSPAAG